MKTIEFYLEDLTIDLINTIVNDCINSPNSSYPLVKLQQYADKFNAQLDRLLWGQSDNVNDCYQTLWGLCRYAGKLQQHRETLTNIKKAFQDQ
jgi:hypothetical protein